MHEVWEAERGGKILRTQWFHDADEARRSAGLLGKVQ
jgi:hypothetical protein